MSEIGFTGLRISYKFILEERRKELRFPQANFTYKHMAEDATIFSALQLFEMMLSRVDWYVETPKDASPELQNRAKILEEIMEDMDHSWLHFIKEVCSVFTYGYCVNEKVFRRRYFSNGSKYNDGYVGLKKLPVRSQDTIYGWVFSPDRRELEAVQQTTLLFDNNAYYQYSSDGNTQITIPRDKFLLFRVDSKRENPTGRSPLNGCYVAWRYRTELEEQEAISLVRGLGGIPVIRMASRYMSADATPDEKAIYAYYKQIGRNLQSNEQSTVILPSEYDPDTKQPLFDIQLMGVNGNQAQDTSAVINRWDNKILMALFSDLLKMGSDKLGSFALADSKSSIMLMAVESRLKEIQDVINSDLVPDIFRRNGWSTQEMPKIVFGDIDEIDLDKFSSAVQRIFATGAVEYERDVMNVVRERVFDLPPIDATQEVNMDKIPNSTSRSGDGMSSGLNNGVGKSTGGKGDASTSNKA